MRRPLAPPKRHTRIHQILKSMPDTLPVIFFGHGSPMIALQTNAVTETWQGMVRDIPRPRAILCISAHWCTRGSAVTAMTAPRTIHDFGAFPKALFEVRYPAPGSPALAERVRELLAPKPVLLDRSAWGFDHGTWSVLVKLYPQADIPVVQLSLDATQSPQHHFELGRQLAPLRDEGVLLIGTGNIVHNLGVMNWALEGEGYDWAERFNGYVRSAVAANQPERLVNYLEAGEDAEMSVPTPEHYLPLLYVAGARRPEDRVRFDNDHIEYGSVGMTSVSFGA